MKIIKSISLEQGEHCVATHANTAVTVKKRNTSYSRNARIIQTQNRIIIDVKSTLGGTKEIIEIPYLSIKALRTCSEISSTGLTIVLVNEAVHLDFFRNHLRACQIYVLCCLVAMASSPWRGSPTRFIRELTIDAVVPDDLFSADIRWGDGIPGLLAEWGIIVNARSRPRIEASKLNAWDALSRNQEDIPGSTNHKGNLATTDAQVPIQRYHTNDDASLKGKPYRVLRILREQGEYVAKGLGIIWVDVEGRETIIAATSDGYLSFNQMIFIGGTYFFGDQIFSILPTPQQSGVEQRAPAASPIDSQTSSTSNDQTQNLLDEIDSLIGMNDVKREMRGLVSYAKIQQERCKRLGMREIDISRHLVLTGSPGTGKTTVARLIGKAYKSLGLLTKGHFLEVDRSALVAGYLGQTAIKTREILESAKGGVLFIDEAYALAPTDKEDQYGQESIETILKFMEDHRDDIVIAVAGYPEPMKKFLTSNPGLKSRFNTFLHFEDYSEAELLEIFKRFAGQAQMVLSLAGLQRLRDILSRVSELKGDNFSNARAMRNLFELSLRRQANRLATQESRTKEDLITLDRDDFEYEDAVTIAL